MAFSTMQWTYAFLPVVVATGGALFTLCLRPGEKAVGAIQHFAAGLVFYAAAGELLPDAMADGLVWPLLLGVSLGVVAMLVLRHFEGRARGPAGMLGASAVDAVIDGVALGLGFTVGQHQGLLLAIALAVEFLFLGLALATAFGRDTSGRRVVFATLAVAFMVPVGALLAVPLAGLPGPWRAAAFAFGLIALLYLVTEELLVEAHEKPETAWGAALFFVGFLGLAVIDQVLGA